MRAQNVVGSDQLTVAERGHELGPVKTPKSVKSQSNASQNGPEIAPEIEIRNLRLHLSLLGRTVVVIVIAEVAHSRDEL